MSDLIIRQLGSACRALAEASNAQQAKKVVDMARAAEVYFQRQKLGEEAIKHATAVKIDAMTLLGEFLRLAPKNKGANGSTVTGSKREPVKDETPTLADVG